MSGIIHSCVLYAKKKIPQSPIQKKAPFLSFFLSFYKNAAYLSLSFSKKKTSSRSNHKPNPIKKVSIVKKPAPFLQTQVRKINSPSPPNSPRNNQRRQNPRARTIRGRNRFKRNGGTLIGIRAKTGITLGRATGFLARRGSDVLDQIRLDDFEGRELLADARGAVPYAVVGPFGAAGDLVAAAGTLGCGGLGGGREVWRGMGC